MNMRTRFLYLATLTATTLLATGCADPTADAPVADVAAVAGAAIPEPTVAPPATAEEYELAGTIGFVGSKVTGSHDGGFETFDGTVTVVGEDVESSRVALTIDTTSLWADNDRLTGHLKSEDFFDIETYPTSTFESTAIEALEEGGFTVTGVLDLHGTQKEISFPAQIELSPEGFSATAEFSINRFDFGIVYPGKKDDLIREGVLIRLDLHSAAATPEETLEDSSEDSSEGEEAAAE